MTRRRVSFALMLVALLGLAVWFTLHTLEPMYQRKKLSHWLQQLELSQDIESPVWREAVHALRQIGTNAVPHLLSRLQATDPEWKLNAVEWVRPVLDRDFSGWLSARDRDRSLLALQALGSLAQPAVPTLATLLTNANPNIADTAFAAFSAIGVPECVPPLVQTLTNRSVIHRRAAAVTLGTLRSNASKAVPGLIVALQNHDDALRTEAARALGFIASNPQASVPALTQALSDTNRQVQWAAALALGAFGTDAESALPILQKFPAEADEPNRRGVARSLVRVQCELRDGAIIRGPKDERRIALVFTGHEFAEGGETILEALKAHGGRGSFFLTGDFLRHPQFAALVNRIASEGHYLGPHSDKHLLYCAWDDKQKTLVSEDEFRIDLMANARLLPEGWPRRRSGRYYLPPFEHYNRTIADWARKQRWSLINYTPGTRSHADYTGEADQNFVSSSAILNSILQYEQKDPHGLNGFILLLHLGSGPGRADKFHLRFEELLTTLAAKGYRFVGVDELLEPKRQETPDEYSIPSQR